MLDAVIAASGLWFAIAIAVQAVSALFEQAGAARSPDEERPHGPAVFFMGASALLTPGILLAHAYMSTHDVEPTIRIVALGSVIAAVLGASLIGAVLGAVAKGAAPVMRMIALPLSVAALALAIYAALPTIQLLIQAAQNGGVIYAN